MKAFKLITINKTDSSFLEGEVPELCRVSASYAFVQKQVDHYELHMHTAPRYQFVVTLKGRLRFTVTNGASFIIEPGILLVAADLTGKGHSWEIIDGDEWQRMYVVLAPGADDGFVTNTDAHV